jgi:RNA polymerase-binding protein DksA
MDIERFRTALLEERKRIEEAKEYLKRETDGLEDETEENEGGVDNHLADQAAPTLDREIDYTLEENAEQLLEQIDAALARIEAGTYGVCEVDGKPIPEERLEARPWATLCIDHQRALEHG